MGWVQSLDAVATIRLFREQAQQLRDIEVEKAIRQLGNGERAEEVLQKLAHALTNKLMHSPSSQLRQAGFDGRNELLDAARELFELKNSDN